MDSVRLTSDKTLKRGPSAQASGEETRQRIIDAAIATLRTEGMNGASARAIARHGGFNQALIFYHFGSVDGLLMAAAAREGERRAVRYEERFAAVRSLPEIVTVARQAHEEEQRDGSVMVLAQLLAGAASSPGLRHGIRDGVLVWMRLVEDAIARVLAGSSVSVLMPASDLAFAVSSMFVGIELMTGLEFEEHRAAALFDGMDKVAALLEAMVLREP